MRVERIEDQDQSQPCPIARIDNFAIGNSTHECGLRRHVAKGVGVMEAGYRVPVAVTELRWKTGSDAEDI